MVSRICWSSRRNNILHEVVLIAPWSSCMIRDPRLCMMVMTMMMAMTIMPTGWYDNMGGVGGWDEVIMVSV